MRRLTWIFAICASIVWLITISPIPEHSGLDGHQRGVAFLIDGAARSAVCVLVIFAPRIRDELKTFERPGWLGVSIARYVLLAAYLPVVVVLALMQLLREAP